ncbi:Prokaryotic membrane lipoprotein lipid attachment site profile (plasmid) [Nostoc flagelliforme CCNUN1]|uniref:Prokaryotic membrane lipoprotein lipid attachment site profile n=1 Tax=Nostoc flagelliforme CCNUN1 TaxID=2038116 RepID=A0A2K8TAV0_9NOSO|nr:Prokaryotic membrane lipoprotein lipid attachment site profile [Nostoc flagelliforme CCNUN1]
MAERPASLIALSDPMRSNTALWEFLLFLTIFASGCWLTNSEGVVSVISQQLTVIKDSD